ncbi:MAG: DUF4070 domain-containing protein [Proteobacteria bacterium]|nr:DUF4070 domain-containing protein [Pseudomonadota bacterium]
MNTRKVKNALLVYPEVPQNTYWSFHYALPFINKKSSMPPLGLITLAAYFPDSYDLKLVDMNVASLNEDDIRWADTVFLTAMIIQKDSFREVVEICNRLNTPVVAGGPYPTSNHGEITGVDHLVLGEVEDTFQDFLIDLENGTAKNLYAPPPYPDMSRTKVPRFDLLEMDAYGSMAIQYSRGCPFKCEFCDIWSVYGNKPRLKSPESMIAELDALYGLGWKGALFVVDDNFIGNKNRVKKELLPAIESWQKQHRYVFRFFTEASINMADDDNLLSAMRSAGFNEVFIGIETPSLESLRETGKNHNLKTDMQQAVYKIQSHGIGVMGGFILGFDSDTDDTVENQISFIQQTGIPQAMIGLLDALPGTKLYRRLEKEGRILETSQGNNTHSMTTNFVTKMDSEKLKEGYKKILSSIYDSNLKNYFARCKRLLDNIGDRPFFQREVHFKEIVMFLKSLFRQPFTPYGFQYIKFLLRNLIKHRSTFAEAVRFAIIGHHFHTITQETLKAEKIVHELEKSYRYLREQLDKQSASIMENSKEAVHNIAELWNKKTKTLKRINKKVDKIHVDFRNDVVNKYNTIDRKIREMFKATDIDFKQNNLDLG